MKENVIINITGFQPDVQGDEPVAMTMPGIYMRKGDTVWLAYDQADEDGNVSACRMKICHKTVELTRKGSIVSQMFFEEGTEYACSYATAYGQLDMSIVTDSVGICSDENHPVDLELRYRLYTDGEFVSNCILRMTCEKVSKHNI